MLSTIKTRVADQIARLRSKKPTKAEQPKPHPLDPQLTALANDLGSLLHVDAKRLHAIATGSMGVAVRTPQLLEKRFLGVRYDKYVVRVILSEEQMREKRASLDKAAGVASEAVICAGQATMQWRFDTEEPAEEFGKRARQIVGGVMPPVDVLAFPVTRPQQVPQ